MSEDTLSKIDIEKKVDDWILRVSALYFSIKEWLDSIPSYTAKEQSDVTMYEELMQKYEVSPIKLKVLDIYNGDHIVATVKPIGLWIIGANGRVDILSKNVTVSLIDESTQFQNTNWVAYKRTKKNKGRPFNKKYFLELLGVLEREQSSKLITEKQYNLSDWKYRRSWDILPKEKHSDKISFLNRVALLIDKGSHYYQKIKGYYELRNTLGHGGTFSSPVSIPTVVTDFELFYKIIKA